MGTRKRGRATANVAAMMSMVNARSVPWACRGRNRTATAPASGRPMSQLSSCVLSAGGGAVSMASAAAGHMRATNRASSPAVSAMGPRTLQGCRRGTREATPAAAMTGTALSTKRVAMTATTARTTSAASWPEPRLGGSSG